MLKSKKLMVIPARWLTAMCLLPPLYVLIFWASPILLTIVSAFIFLMVANEWSALAGICRWQYRMGYLFVNALLMWWCYHYATWWINVYTLIVWLGLLIQLLRYPHHLPFWHQQKCYHLLLGSSLLIPAWYSIIYLREHTDAMLLIILLFLMTITSDTVAYFAGRRLGRHPLAKTISPNKTQEGALVAIVATWLLAWFFVQCFLPGLSQQPLALAALLLLCIIQSIFGDLVQSLLKRLAQVKDSGRFLPGHGGLFDRMDSLIAVAPLYALCIVLIYQSG